MNAILPRFLRSAYRKEPIPSFLITIGAVDALIGGVGDRWVLFGFGITTVAIAFALRWWLLQQNKVEPLEPVRQQRYLPPYSADILPTLAANKKNSRR
ncbi:hypothetical protein [Aliterella atlantica]|uniref:Uncharacterized protein n=1 Tax=Aliterella atlantica CENA595 TaxID=1618023 RepID=A0A0D8ZTH3_9CYAN|nr:hypothetical protein [Aliterella atlantica]KJH70541.1 hypothetical protein UH38_17365 [Aliterella atlantica CENA595]